ncbi:MAG: response regulator transcription factor [Clostridia bacterium]|nr:response regulator transcription factor [Clostridia bacterium]
MNFAIIDDDKVFSEKLSDHISEFCNSETISCSVTLMDPQQIFTSDTELLAYDVIFLDIEMPQIGGIELAHKINQLKGSKETPYIVFVTARDNLVFDALQAFPYSFIRKSHITEINACVHNLYTKLCSTPTYKIKSGRDIKTLEIKNILYLEKQGNYTAFITSTGIFLERSVIDDKHKDLQEHGFLRPHIGYLVNATHITGFTGANITLSCGKEINVSRNYKQSFKADFNEWLVKIK